MILIFVIAFSEALHVQNTMSRKRIGSRMVSRKSEKSHLHTSKARFKSHRRTREVCQTGFGFEGYRVSQAPQLIINHFRQSDKQVEKEDVWKQIIEPLITRFASEIFDIALGDFSGKRSSSELSHMLCKSLPLGDDQTAGFIGLSIGHLPCGTPTLIQLCLMFDRCGSFGLAINAGIASCLIYLSGAQLTGIGAIIAEAVKTIKKASISFSYNGKLAKKTSLLVVNERDPLNPEIEDKSFAIPGHLYASIGIGLPLPDIKIGSKPLSEYFGNISLSEDIFFNFGNLIETIKTTIETIKNSNNIMAEIVNTLKKTNIDFVFTLNESFSLKLDKLSEGFFPDIGLGLPGINALFTTGNGVTAQPAGVYVKVLLANGNTISSAIETIVKHFVPILQIIKVDFKLNGKFDFTNISLGLILSWKYIGFYFDAAIFKLKCLYSFEIKKGGCHLLHEGLTHIFTALHNAGEFLLIHAASFFSEIGRVLGVAKERALKVIDTTGDKIHNFFTKLGKDVRNTATNATRTVGQWFRNAAEATGGWFTRHILRRNRRRLRKKLFRRFK